jgi:hypothetical protein
VLAKGAYIEFQSEPVLLLKGQLDQRDGLSELRVVVWDLRGVMFDRVE